MALVLPGHRGVGWLRAPAALCSRQWEADACILK